MRNGLSSIARLPTEISDLAQCFWGVKRADYDASNLESMMISDTIRLYGSSAFKVIMEESSSWLFTDHVASP